MTVDHNQSPAEGDGAAEPYDSRGPTTLEGWRSAALAGEKERDWLREQLTTALRHQGKDCWYWQNDGEDHLESLTNALPVVIRADHLRALLANVQPKGMPAEWLDAFEEWRQTLGAADLDGKRDLVWRHIAGTGFQAGAAWARSQAPAPVAESSGARLALCPFCGRRPVLTVRPDNAEATSYFAAVACFCDGYAACAHKDATAAEADEAERLVREKWNRRATASPAVAHQPETAMPADNTFNTAFLKLQEISAEAGAVKGYWPGDSDRIERVVKLAHEVIDLLMLTSSGDFTHEEYIALTNPGALKPLEVGFGSQESHPPVQGTGDANG